MQRASSAPPGRQSAMDRAMTRTRLADAADEVKRRGMSCAIPVRVGMEEGGEVSLGVGSGGRACGRLVLCPLCFVGESGSFAARRLTHSRRSVERGFSLHENALHCITPSGINGSRQICACDMRLRGLEVWCRPTRPDLPSSDLSWFDLTDLDINLVPKRIAGPAPLPRSATFDTPNASALYIRLISDRH